MKVRSRRSARGVLACVAFGALLGSTPALGADGSVTVSKGKQADQTPCPEVRDAPVVRLGTGRIVDRSAPLLMGGCPIDFTGEADMEVLTAVGELRFARCLFDFDARVDARGRVGLTHIEILGPFPCNDVVLCYEDPETPLKPPRGAISSRPDGGLVLEIDMCLDTCMGRFAGPMELSMERGERGRWRLATPSAPIGASGWRMAHGRWRSVGSHTIDVRGGGGRELGLAWPWMFVA